MRQRTGFFIALYLAFTDSMNAWMTDRQCKIAVTTPLQHTRGFARCVLIMPFELLLSASLVPERRRIYV